MFLLPSVPGPNDFVRWQGIDTADARFHRWCSADIFNDDNGTMLCTYTIYSTLSFRFPTGSKCMCDGPIVRPTTMASVCSIQVLLQKWWLTVWRIKQETRFASISAVCAVLYVTQNCYTSGNVFEWRKAVLPAAGTPMGFKWKQFGVEVACPIWLEIWLD